jgi:hypothetical protein
MPGKIISLKEEWKSFCFGNANIFLFFTLFGDKDDQNKVATTKRKGYK